MEDIILKAIEDLKVDSNRRFDALTSQVNTLSTRLDNLSDQVGKQSTRVDNLSDQVGKQSNRVDNLSNQVNTLTSQVNENTQILKALEHLAQVNKAEHDKMMVDIAETKGDVKAIRKDLSAVELVTANNWSDIVKLKSIK